MKKLVLITTVVLAMAFNAFAEEAVPEKLKVEEKVVKPIVMRATNVISITEPVDIYNQNNEKVGRINPDKTIEGEAKEIAHQLLIIVAEKNTLISNLNTRIKQTDKMMQLFLDSKKYRKLATKLYKINNKEQAVLNEINEIIKGKR